VIFEASPFRLDIHRETHVPTERLSFAVLPKLARARRYGERNEAFYRTADPYPGNSFSQQAILIKPFANVVGILIPVQKDQRYPATAGSRALIGENAQGAVYEQPRRARALASRDRPACGLSQTECRGKRHDKR
jgi:hypothetical protein